MNSRGNQTYLVEEELVAKDANALEKAPSRPGLYSLERFRIVDSLVQGDILKMSSVNGNYILPRFGNKKGSLL